MKSCKKAQQVRLILEYHSFPLWICDEDGILIETGMVDELADDAWLEEQLRSIQAYYNGLFVDNKMEFSFVGVSDISEAKRFAEQVENIFQYIQKRIGSIYTLRIDHVTWEDFIKDKRQG